MKKIAELFHSKNLNFRWIEWHIKEGRSKDNRRVGQTPLHLCRMGQMYAKVFPDSETTRCCSAESESLGNCPCFKAMFVGEEQSWQRHWGAPEYPQFPTEKIAAA